MRNALDYLVFVMYSFWIPQVWSHPTTTPTTPTTATTTTTTNDTIIMIVVIYFNFLLT